MPLILCVAAVWILKEVRGCAKEREQAAGEIAEKFKTGNISKTFISRVTEIEPTGGDILEVATMKSEEIFRSEDSREICGIPQGKIIVEIREPATYRYHVRLTDPWHLVTRGKVCIVQAPGIRASLPPAVHTNERRVHIEVEGLRFNSDDQVRRLEASITPTLRERAQDAKHLALVREACRVAVAKFVRTWLLAEDHWRDDRFTAVIVVFPDEQSFSTDDELARYPAKPVLRLEEDKAIGKANQASQP